MKTCVDELCQENTFLFKGSVDVFVTLECIHLYILYCISLYPDVRIGSIINIINSCKVIEVNPPF